MAVTKKQKTPAPAAGVDPKFELAEKAGSYVLRLALPDLTKSDFRVQVDGAGRLTVRGTKTGTLGSPSLHKVFQLPSDARLDDIAGRFEGGVLTLTVPRCGSSSAGTPPTTVEEIKRKLPGVAKETKPKEEEMGKEDALKKKEATEDSTKKAQQQRKQEEEVKKEEVKPKAPQAPSTTPPPEPALVKKQEEMKPKAPSTAPPQEAAPVKKQEEGMEPKAPQVAAAAETPPAEKPAPRPEAAAGSEKAKAAVGPDSLAERVRQHDKEEQHAKAAATAEKEVKEEREKKATAACAGNWKERATGQLKGLTDMRWAEGLTDMKWADGVVEVARNNKEVVAVGIAAFSLGFLVSHKLFRK